MTEIIDSTEVYWHVDLKVTFYKIHFVSSKHEEKQNAMYHIDLEADRTKDPLICKLTTDNPRLAHHFYCETINNATDLYDHTTKKGESI